MYFPSYTITTRVCSDQSSYDAAARGRFSSQLSGSNTQRESYELVQKLFVNPLLEVFISVIAKL